MVKRDISIDALRGIVIILMVASHVVSFVGHWAESFWIHIVYFGNTVCFATFLFLFGISSYHLFIGSQKTSEEIKHRFYHRLNFLLIAYFIMALAGTIKDLFQAPVKTISSITSFTTVPGFTEFMIPFIIFTLIVYPLRNFLRKIIHHKYGFLYTVILGMGLFILGNVLHYYVSQSNVSEKIVPYLSMLWGHKEGLKFPVLQYSMVFLFGIFVGSLGTNTDNVHKFYKKYDAKNILLFGSAFFLCTLLILSLFKEIEYVSTFDRWPPSLFFISVGMTFAFLMLYVLQKTVYLSAFQNKLSHIGRRSMEILIFHLVFLRLLELTPAPRTYNFIIIFICFIICLLGWDFISVLIRRIKLIFNNANFK
jgi:hypothetical protein